MSHAEVRAYFGKIRAGIEHMQPDIEDARERRAELRSIDEYKTRLAAATDE